MSKKRSHLSTKFADLRGAEALTAYRSQPILLEAIWRASDGEMARRLVSDLAGSGDEILVGLLLDEVLLPYFATPEFATCLVAELSQHQSRLASGDVKLLLEHLRESDRNWGVYAAHLPTLQLWALSQQGRYPDDLAVDVLVGEHNAAVTDPVRERARLRCTSTPELSERTCAALLVADFDRASVLPEAWKIIEALADLPPANLPLLVRKAVEEALTRGTDLPPRSPELVAKLAGPEVLDLLAGFDCERRPDGVLRLLVAIDKEDEAVFKPELYRLLLVECAAALNGQWLEFVDAWDELGWVARLRFLIDLPEGTDLPPGLATLVARGPLACTSQMVELALRWSESPNNKLLREAGRRLGERVADRPSSDEFDDMQLAACWWPPSPTDTQIDTLNCVLDAAFTEGRVGFVLDAYSAGRCDADTCARLIPASSTQDALDLVEPGAQRGSLCRSLWEAHPAETADAVRVLQTAKFSLDLCEASLHQPTVAFAGASAAWYGADESTRDRVSNLVGAYGTSGEKELLERILEDTRGLNSTRRGQAATTLARVVPAGSSVPEPLLNLLSSSRPELQGRAVAAIAEIGPENAEVVRQVRVAALQPGVSGAAPEAALNRLEERYLSLLTDDCNFDDCVRYLGLIGAAASNKGIKRLLEFVGGNAIDDDVEVRQAAAVALAEAAKHPREPVSPELHTTLVEMLDGDRPEVDPSARTYLGAAVTSIGLGEDAALAVLYGMTFDPHIGADALFGNEKGALVRHLELFMAEKARGVVGQPAAVCQLDLVAERLVRAAYLRCGTSEPVKAAIRRQVNGDPKYGPLIQGLSSVASLNNARDSLGVLHRIRNSRTEMPHSGTPMDSDTYATAITTFTDAAKALIGVLKDAPSDGAAAS